MTTDEILREMIREADISRDQAHAERLHCIDRHDWDGYENLTGTCENLHEYIMTIIEML